MMRIGVQHMKCELEKSNSISDSEASSDDLDLLNSRRRKHYCTCNFETEHHITALTLSAEDTTCTRLNKPRHKVRRGMAQHTRPINPGDIGSCPRETPALIGEGIRSLLSKENDEAKRVFPFLSTPSGNLKIIPNQVVFESKKVSVLVADPKHTKVNVKAELGKQGLLKELVSMPQKQITYGQTDGDFVGNHFHTEIKNEVHDKIEPQPEPEFTLDLLGSSDSIDWSKVSLPNKTDLNKLLLYRITNHVNPDVAIQISDKLFNCHLIVLQCYSLYFDALKDQKQIQLPESMLTSKTFTAIYSWMINLDKESYRPLDRGNIIEIFVASQFLGIKELEEQCWAFINSEEIFSEETAYSLFIKAKKLGNTDITELMLPRITKFFLRLVSSKNFLQHSVKEICSILRSNYIAVHCEIEVFMSAVRWLMYNWKGRQVHLLEVMQCIRFGLIAPWQLVDIRRNPENPEFMEITVFNEVQQLIEDGLAYAIIKYWYGNQTQDYYHWIDLLGLEEPSARNWIGEEKNYVTFKEFLKDMKLYRQPNALEKMDARREENVQIKTKDPLPSEHKVLDVFSPPTIAEYMAHRECVSQVSTVDSLKQKSILEEEEDVYQMNVKMVKSEDNATILLHHNNKILKELNSEPILHDHLSSTENIRDSQHKVGPRILDNSIGNNNNYSHQSTSTQEKILPITGNRSSQEVMVKESQEKVLPVWAASIQETNDSISFANATPFKHTRQMSESVLGPVSKNYLAEGSLFFADREAVLVFGGIDPNSQYGVGRNTGKDIYRYQPQSNYWEFIGELPEPRQHHSVAFLKGRVFLAGGADPRDDDVRGKSIVVSTVWSYEPVKRSWFSESGMLNPRKNFGLIVSNGKLYAIGGQDRQGRVLSSVERFDPITGVWDEMAQLNIGRMGLSSTKFHGFIWVAGGMTSSKKNPLTKEVERYDIRRNIWLPFTSLRFPICFGRFFSMSDCLYIIGGAGRMTDRDRTTSSTGIIDVWNDTENKWHQLTEMSIPRHGHSVAYLGTQIFIIGGVTTVYMRALSNVECFCCERETWIRGVCNLPTTLSGQDSITLPPASLM